MEWSGSSLNEGITFAVFMDREELKMRRQNVIAILGPRSRIRVRDERSLCANAGDNSQRSTDIRRSGSVCRRTGPGGD